MVIIRAHQHAEKTHTSEQLYEQIQQIHVFNITQSNLSNMDIERTEQNVLIREVPVL